MKDKILELLNGIRPEFDFTSSDDFVEDGYLDSFDITTLVGELENEFGIIIDGFDVDPENFVSLDALEALVLKSRKMFD